MCLRFHRVHVTVVITRCPGVCVCVCAHCEMHVTLLMAQNMIRLGVSKARHCKEGVGGQLVYFHNLFTHFFTWHFFDLTHGNRDQRMLRDFYSIYSIDYI